jgi:hypothetical protein
VTADDMEGYAVWRRIIRAMKELPAEDPSDGLVHSSAIAQSVNVSDRIVSAERTGTEE